MTVAFSTPLGSAMADYLALKQSLGRKFNAEGRVLAHLDRFLAARSPSCTALTPHLFDSWCITFADLNPNTRRIRQRVVRGFCVYMRRMEPSCFVPDSAAFPTSQPPRPPHIFSREEIVHLLRTTAELRPRSTLPLHAETYRLAVVLLYTLGLRCGELVRLMISDYNPFDRTLLIRESKFYKSRLVALSLDATLEMKAYLKARRRLSDGADGPLLVCSHGGLRARSSSGLGAGLRRLFQRAGICDAAGKAPHTHDLRHTHAVHALLRWYRAGVDVQAKLPVLATSMGHVSLASTSYYLALLDPIAELASERFAIHAAPILGSVLASRGNP